MTRIGSADDAIHEQRMEYINFGGVTHNLTVLSTCGPTAHDAMPTAIQRVDSHTDRMESGDAMSILVSTV